MRARTLLAILATLAVGCDGIIGDVPGGGGGPLGDSGEVPDGGLDGFVPSECGPAGDAILFFERSCAGCHQGNRAFPDLTRAGLPALRMLMSEGNPGEPLLVPNDPEASWLYRKMAHTQGASGGAGMPLGRDRPVAELGMVEAWIREGAPTECDDLAPSDIPYDPNALDPDELFRCEDATAPRSSPARVRRIDYREFDAISLGRSGDNPLEPPAGTRYTTYADDISVDTTTLSLLMPQFPSATRPWAEYDPSGARTYGVYRTGIVRCMEEGSPDEECIDQYIEALFVRGASFRSPSVEEFMRLRAFLVEEIRLEAELGHSRVSTLRLVSQAARLSSSALFRPELGENAEPRRRLSNDEIALVLGHVISVDPVGQLIHNDPSPAARISPDDPDGDDLAAGRLGLLRAAANDGSIASPETRVALLRHYAGGVAELRPDLHQRGNDNPARGEYWLGTNLLAFFREWLGYDDADTVFKDNAAATSAEAELDWGPSFGNLRSKFNGREGSLEEQLDDLIARLVLETDEGDGDIFEELLTTTTWHLPSNLGAGSSRRCESEADCSDGQPRCATTGYCTSTTSRYHIWMQAVFGIHENVGTSREDRWVEMDPSRRMGVLTHPAWLAAHGANFEDDASLIERGLWIRTQIFCQSFGSLDDVQGLVAMLPARSDDGSDRLSARQRVFQATEDPEVEGTQACFGCHQYMNSLGYPFELFNHAGFERATDHHGAPDGSTVIDNLPDPALNRAYATPFELLQAIAMSAYARRGFVRHAFRFFMGRDEVLADGCTLVEMEEALNRTGSYLSMLEALVASETFVYRHMPEEGDGR